MKNKHMRFIMAIMALALLLPTACKAMPPGAIMFRTSGQGKMAGYSKDPLVEVRNKVVSGVNSGHAAIYIGKVKGTDYIVEALANGVVMTPAEQFLNEAEGEIYLGAKIPKGLSAVRQARAVALAKSLADMNLGYDFDFRDQKGPESGKWTCVGLIEKIYESSDIPNPNNLAALEYDPAYYAIDITPDGFDDCGSEDEDCLSDRLEFSRIARRTDILMPAPEILGFDLGREEGDNRYIFLPYTQYAQPSLDTVETDINISSVFDGASVRGSINPYGLAMRWSLINNPLSSIRSLVRRASDSLAKLFGKDDAPIVISEEEGINSLGTTSKTKSKTATKANVKKAEPKKKVEDGAMHKSETNTKEKEADVKTTSGAKKETTQDEDNEVFKTATNPSVSNPQINYYAPAPSPIVTQNNVTVEDNYEPQATIQRIYATGGNDWIELYNPTSRDFDLAEAGFRLEKAKSAADPTLIMRIGNEADGEYPGGTVIRAKSKYMIAASGASDYFSDEADAIATKEAFSWSDDGYTIFLGRGAISSYDDEDISEAVGFGPEATYFQGSGPAPAIKDYYVLSRISDTENNAEDFKLVRSDDPSIDWDIIEPTVTTTAPDDEEEDNNTSATTSPAVYINGIYGFSSNDWIELKNFGTEAVNLSEGFRLEKAKTAQDPGLMIRFGEEADGSYPGGTVIGPQESYLIVRDDASDNLRSKADAIASRTDFSWGESGYTVYLARDAVSSSDDSDIIDLLGFGEDATWYWHSPAPALDEEHYLARIATSGKNELDYELRDTQLPDENMEDDGGMGIYSFTDDSYDLFVPPEAYDGLEPDLLWHFDECGGKEGSDELTGQIFKLNGLWTHGRFGCGPMAGYSGGQASSSLEGSIDTNKLTIAFWFKAEESFPRLSMRLIATSGEFYDVTLEEGLMQFTGLPNPDWRYYQDVPIDDEWRLATLVVDREDGYWAFYVDGERRFFQSSYKLLVPFSRIDFGGDGGNFSIDELAIWEESLSLEDIRDYYEAVGPLEPSASPVMQSRPRLTHFWDFNEAIGNISTDRVASSIMRVHPNSWFSLDTEDAVTQLNWAYSASSSFSDLETGDLSLSFLWRSPDIVNGNRCRVSLMSGEQPELFSYLPGQGATGFFFNGYYSYFSYGAKPEVFPVDENWHLVTYVYDSFRHLLRLNVDGEEKASRIFLWGRRSQRADSIQIVSENGQCELDDLGVWEGALSPAQIEEIYASYK